MKYLFGASLLAIGFLVLSCGEKSDKTNRNTKNIDTTIVLSLKENKASKNFPSDVYFKANGTEPFWSLEISEKIIKFKSITDSFFTPHAKPVSDQNSNSKIYKIRTESVQLDITINHNECTNAMSGEVFPYSVTIDYRKTIDKNLSKLNGCGKYITDYRFHDIWVLEELNGKKVTKGDFQKEFPYMEINANKNIFTGFAGCNRMNGTLLFEHDDIAFKNIATSKMMCPDQNKKEQEFLTALQHCSKYTIGNNRLTLSSPKITLLIFKKID